MVVTIHERIYEGVCVWGGGGGGGYACMRALGLPRGVPTYCNEREI